MKPNEEKNCKTHSNAFRFKKKIESKAKKKKKGYVYNETHIFNLINIY